MAVKYLSGNRLWGTDAERLALSTIYKVHTFTSNGTFAITGTGTVEHLIVAGGGGGCSGGGGAGGYRSDSASRSGSNAVVVIKSSSRMTLCFLLVSGLEGLTWLKMEGA